MFRRSFSPKKGKIRGVFLCLGPLEKRLNSHAFHACIQGFESPTGHYTGGLAQLGEHLPYKQRVGGSIPSSSTIKNSVNVPQ